MKTLCRRKNGYTLPEVLMAAGLLGVMLGGAVRLLGTMNTAEVGAQTNAVGLNLLENAVRLWQLGLSPTEVQSVLPIATNNDILDRAVVSDGSGLTAIFDSSGTYTMANSMGTLEKINVSVTIEDPQGSKNRIVSATAYRPTSR